MANNFKFQRTFFMGSLFLLWGCEQNREIVWSFEGVSKIATYQNVVTRSVDSQFRIDLNVGVPSKTGAMDSMVVVSWADRKQNSSVFTDRSQGDAPGSYIKVDFSKLIGMESLQGDVLRLSKELMELSAISEEVAKYNPDVLEAQKANRFQFLARMGSLSIQDTKSKSNVLGYPCDIFELLSDNKKFAEYCMSRAQDLQLSQKEFKDFKWYFDSSSKVESSFLSQAKLFSERFPDQVHIKMKLFDEKGNTIMDQTLNKLEIRKGKSDPKNFIPPENTQYVSFEDHLTEIRNNNEATIAGLKSLKKLTEIKKPGKKAQKNKK